MSRGELQVLYKYIVNVCSLYVHMYKLCWLHIHTFVHLTSTNLYYVHRHTLFHIHHVQPDVHNVISCFTCIYHAASVYVWFCLLLDKCVHMHPCARPFNSELNISLVPRRKVTRNEASSIYTCLHIDVCVCMYYNAICVYVRLFILGQVCTHMSTSKASHVTFRSMYMSALVCMYVCMFCTHACM